MRKYCVLLLICLVLSGCGARQTFETVSDLHIEGTIPPAKTVHLDLPEEAAAPVMESEDSGKLYLCDSYTVTVQTMSGGDLNGTIQSLTGFSRDALTVVERKVGDITRYDCAWTAAGEGQDQTCRAAILDDGCYHYAVTVMADSKTTDAVQQQWQSVLGSVYLQ